MHRESAYRAAQIAQERALEYLRAVANGEVEPDAREAQAIAERCEETFRAWMSEAGFSVH